MNEYLVSVKNVTKSFQRQKALKDVSLNITRGRFHALVGENGSGKSTLVKSIIGTYPPSAYAGVINLAPDTTISYTPEVANFPSQFDVHHYLLSIAKLLYPNVNEADLVVEKAVAKFNINDLLAKKPNKLSTGEKKKVLLAKIAIEDADLIVMDEPAANLDFSSRKFLFDTLAEFNALGKTILIVSHMTTEINHYINEMSLLHYGEVWVNRIIKPGELTLIYEKSIATRAQGLKVASQAQL